MSTAQLRCTIADIGGGSGMMKRTILRQLLVRKIGLARLHFVLDLPHADGDAEPEAYLEADDND
jgi:hypothetical protein